MSRWALEYFCISVTFSIDSSDFLPRIQFFFGGGGFQSHLFSFSKHMSSPRQTSVEIVN